MQFFIITNGYDGIKKNRKKCVYIKIDFLKSIFFGREPACVFVFVHKLKI
jgi:hypothetical protein